LKSVLKNLNLVLVNLDLMLENDKLVLHINKSVVNNAIQSAELQAGFFSNLDFQLYHNCHKFRKLKNANSSKFFRVSKLISIEMLTV